jgi:uncharacterized protein (DUF1800 family)
MTSSRAVLLALAFLTGCGGTSAVRSGAAPATPSFGRGYREQTADQQVRHALSRLSFGARPGDVERVRTMGVDRWIESQFHPSQIVDERAEGFLDRFVIYKKTAAELAEEYPRPKVVAGQQPQLDSVQLRQLQMATRQTQVELMSGRVARAVLTDRQLNEVMTDFWLNHFNIFAAKGPPERYLLPSFEVRTIRPNALGKFRTLLGAVVKDPAMLFYLDNWQSQADSGRPRLLVPGGRGGRGGIAPNAQQMAALRRRGGGLNENYGRELLELHTLGVDGGYSQQDVINAARALTGWTMRTPASGEFFFNPAFHDAGEKTVLGHRLAAGRGIEDGEELLDIVARHPSTARYIAFKLARRFVSDTPPGALVDRAAATFTATDGDIAAVMRTIIGSPEFWSRTAYRSKVKSPFEVVVSALRAVDAQGDGTPQTANMISTLGQPVYGHQAPNGWPETGDQWMNTGAILNRINFGIALAANRVPGASAFGWSGAAELRSAPLEQQVDGVANALLGGEVSPDTRRILLSGENPFLKAAPAPDATMTAAAGSGRPAPRLPQLTGLAQIVGLALGSPEFQRR